MSSSFFPQNKKKPITFFSLNPTKHSGQSKLKPVSFFNLKNNNKFISTPSPFLNSDPKSKINFKSKNPKPMNFFHQFPVKRTKAETRLIDRNPWGDKDKDGVRNIFDCKPFNNKLQTSKKKDVPFILGDLTNKEYKKGLKKWKKWKKDSKSMINVKNRDEKQRNNMTKRYERLKKIINTPISNFTEVINKKGINLENINVIAENPGMVNATNIIDREVRDRTNARNTSKQIRAYAKLEEEVFKTRQFYESGGKKVRRSNNEKTRDEAIDRRLRAAGIKNEDELEWKKKGWLSEAAYNNMIFNDRRNKQIAEEIRFKELKKEIKEVKKKVKETKTKPLKNEIKQTEKEIQDEVLKHIKDKFTFQQNMKEVMGDYEPLTKKLMEERLDREKREKKDKEKKINELKNSDILSIGEKDLLEQDVLDFVNNDDEVIDEIDDTYIDDIDEVNDEEE